MKDHLKINITTPIPRIVHQIQEESNSHELLSYLSILSDTWIQKHPSWQYKLWSLQEVRTLIQTKYPGSLPYPVSDEFLSKIARYFILCTEGGVFVEPDFECIEPFDKLIEGKSFCLFTKTDDAGGQALFDSIVMAERKHPFLSFILSRLKEDKYQTTEKRGHFPDEIFSQYSNNREISLLPYDIINPCTEDEIKLYNYGLLKKEYIIEKTAEAYAICYHKNTRSKAGRVMPKSLTDILYVSTSVGCAGGAFNAGYRIHLGLRHIGLNSKMLVLNSGNTAKDNVFNEIHIAPREKGNLCGYDHDMEPLRAYPRYSISSHGFSPAVVGIDIIKNIEEFNPNLVILHGINGGFATIEDIGKIKRKVVWRLPDCWAFTGGCYYYGSCRRYLTGCGKCPKLGSEDAHDLSYEIWKRKEQAWKNMDMTVVVPTLWMKNAVEKSVLLKDKPVHLIPNGLDLNLYYPIDKQTARKALNIPLNKKVILFGAINAFDPRKGFALLLKALQSLAREHNKEYYLVIFGAQTQVLDLSIPAMFLGYIRDPYILQLAYSAADVMIVPSLEEAFGQTVTEAMACATPVISFRETGPADIIEHKQTGYLAHYADVDDLSNGIQWILGSMNLIDELSAHARERVERSYDIRIIAKQYESLYHRITAL